MHVHATKALPPKPDLLLPALPHPTLPCPPTTGG
jgi:hypothetical protein